MCVCVCVYARARVCVCACARVHSCVCVFQVPSLRRSMITLLRRCVHDADDEVPKAPTHTPRDPAARPSGGA